MTVPKIRTDVSAVKQLLASDKELLKPLIQTALQEASKHSSRPYQSGRSKHWIKKKNREHPAMSRVMDAYTVDFSHRPYSLHCDSDRFCARQANDAMGLRDTCTDTSEQLRSSQQDPRAFIR